MDDVMLMSSLVCEPLRDFMFVFVLLSDGVSSEMVWTRVRFVTVMVMLRDAVDSLDRVWLELVVFDMVSDTLCDLLSDLA